MQNAPERIETAQGALAEVTAEEAARRLDPSLSQQADPIALAREERAIAHMPPPLEVPSPEPGFGISF